MPLDPSIILGAKPPQIDMAQFSPLNAFTTAMKLKQLDQEGELNALTLKERKGLQTFLDTNPDLSLPETRYELATKYGEAGRKLSEGVTNIGKAQTEEAKRRNDLVVSKTGLYRDALIDVNDQRSAIKWLQTQQNDPDMAGSPVAKVSIMDAARSIPADPQGFAQWKQQAALGLSEYIKQNKPVISQVDQSGQTQIFSRPGLGGPLTTLGTYEDVPLPAAVQAQKKEAARAGASSSITNVNAYTPASVEAQKQFVQNASEERKMLRTAPDTIKNIEAAKKLIPSASTFMGKGGEPLLAAASFLNNRLGFSISTQGVTDATVLRTRLFEGILDNLKKLDSQPSQEQQRVLSEALGNLGTDPAALSQILDRIAETVEDRVNRYNVDVTEAEARGVKFPFKPQLTLPSKPEPKDAAAQIPGQSRAAPSASVAIPQGAIDALKAGKGTDAQFDAIFGTGAAKRARGGK
jgi:hypothetical protein